VSCGNVQYPEALHVGDVTEELFAWLSVVTPFLFAEGRTHSLRRAVRHRVVLAVVLDAVLVNSPCARSHHFCRYL
ncbi:hypothetical protein, partial [Hoyosella altamirensis]|uniref:hypothetical protein n=1 Tax=Hoyosella altamirensis TaxID=616997 RepID=UPI001E4DB379